MPLAGASLAFAFGRWGAGRAAQWLTLATLATVAMVLVWARIVGGGEPPRTVLGLWASAYGGEITAEFGIDGLALLTGLVVLVTMTIAFIGSRQRTSDLTVRQSAIALTIVATFLVFAFAQDLLIIYLSWEVLGLLWLLMWQWASTEPTDQPPWPLTIGQALGGAFLLAVLVAGLAADPQSLPPLAGLLILVALMPRLAFFPLHGWAFATWKRPNNPFQAVILLLPMTSGLSLLLRMLERLDASGLFWVWNGLLLIGALAALAGGIQALKARSLPEMVGAAAVAQSGIVAMVMSVGGVFGWGVALFALSSLALGVLLVTIGQALGGDDGQQEGSPAAILLGMGGLILAGMPVLPGFIGQWMAYDTFLISQRWDLALFSLLVMVAIATRIVIILPMPRFSLFSWRWGSAEVSGALVAIAALALGIYPMLALRWVVAPAIPALDLLSPFSFTLVGAEPTPMAHWPVALALALLVTLAAVSLKWLTRLLRFRQQLTLPLPKWIGQLSKIRPFDVADWALWAVAVEERHYLPAIGLFGLGLFLALVGLAMRG
ncbi:MAG: hypothetical protein HYX89_02940 [Chloroflexi bacterium]|nr:hypothetical protein [Chloroflexota bacterium]